MKKLNEDRWAPSISTTDENLSVNALYQQIKLPSLGRQIFTVTPMAGPTAALFSIVSKNDGIQILRNEVEVYEYPSNAPKSRITQEACQDIENQYGEQGLSLVASFLKDLANEDENSKTLEFLKNNSVATSALSLSDPTSSEMIVFNISLKVQQCILEMNSKHLRTYQAYAVLPFSVSSALSALGFDYNDALLRFEKPLLVGRIGLTEWYINPDSTDNNVYVGLKDDNGKGCAVFSPYENEIREAKDYETGDSVLFIWNRYAITASPLHTQVDPLMMKFALN